MIAVPLDNKDATVLSYEYVKAPYFALINPKTGFYKVIENKKRDSLIIEVIHEYGAVATVCHIVDHSILDLCKQRGVSVYETKENRSLTLDNIFEDMHQHVGLFASM